MARCIFALLKRAFLCTYRILIYGITCISNSNFYIRCFIDGALVNIRQATIRCGLALLKELFVRRLLLLGMLGSFLLRGAQLLANSHVAWCQLLGCLEALHRLFVVFEPQESESFAVGRFGAVLVGDFPNLKGIVRAVLGFLERLQLDLKKG